MRFLFTPITMTIWFLLTYCALFYGMVLMLWMFSLSWLWLILGYTILIGIISVIVNTIPILINYVILKFYKLTWLSIITHSLAGLLGILCFYYLLFQHPPDVISETESTPILKALWNESWLKTLFLMFPFIGLQFGIIIQGIFIPISMKLDEESQY